MDNYKGKIALNSGNVGSAAAAAAAAGALVDGAAARGAGVGRVEPDWPERGLQRQVAQDGRAAGVVGHHRPVDVPVRIEVERRHRYVHLDAHGRTWTTSASVIAVVLYQHNTTSRLRLRRTSNRVW